MSPAPSHPSDWGRGVAKGGTVRGQGGAYLVIVKVGSSMSGSMSVNRLAFTWGEGKNFKKQ